MEKCEIQKSHLSCLSHSSVCVDVFQIGYSDQSSKFFHTKLSYLVLYPTVEPALNKYAAFKI